MCNIMRKPVNASCEAQSCRSVFISPQSYLRLCTISAVYMKPSLLGDFEAKATMVSEKFLENEKFFQAREKSGNFGFIQGNLERLRKVSRIFINLQSVYGLKHYFHNNLGLACYQLILQLNL